MTRHRLERPTALVPHVAVPAAGAKADPETEERARLRRRVAELEEAAASAIRSLAEARQREERELATARRIQGSLMPKAFPSPPGWQVAARYRAAREIGGDLYDVYAAHPDREGNLSLSIADVTGKGVTAALLMAFCRAIMRTAAWNADGPADALGRVNRVLARDVRSGLFVTALVVELDPSHAEVRWASAGHEAPLLVRPHGAVSELPAGGSMLGLFDDTRFQEHRLTLRPGETLLLLTDGLTDAIDPRGRRLGQVRLRRVARSMRQAEPESLLDAIVARVDAFAEGMDQADDMTLLALRRQP